MQMSARAFDLSSSKRFSESSSACHVVREAHPPVRVSVFDSSHPGGSKELSSCGSSSLCLIPLFSEDCPIWGKNCLEMGGNCLEIEEGVTPPSSVNRWWLCL